MKTKAAVVYEAGKPIEIEELDLDKPQEGEVLIRYTHAGLCHSDVHVAHGDLEARLPMVLGHEGAGIIEEVGPGVTRVKVGDHVVCSFIPNCGTCRYCASGPAVHLRHGRDHPRGLPARRALPVHRPARRLRRHVHARHLQPVRRDPPELLRQGRRRPAAGEGRARRLRRTHRLGLRGQHRQRPARPDRDGLRRRRHRHQRRPGRALRRREVRHRRRPAGEQAREGDGARRHARVRHRRGGAGGDHRPHPRPDGRLRDPHPRPDDLARSSRAASTPSARAASSCSPA